MSAVTRDAPVRVACIGAGKWGANLVRNFASIGVLHSVYDSSDDVRTGMGATYGVPAASSFAEILADPAVDAVAIATPAENHGALVARALAAGKHVFVEKPLCLDVAEGEELASLAERSGLTLMVGHLLWYHPGVLKLRELLAAGELGRIRYIYSNRLNLGRIRREENILWSFAPHDVSVILGLLGEFPSEVQAQGGNYLHEGIADVTTTLLSFPSGVNAHIFVSWLHPFKEQKLVVVGDRSMAVFDDLEPENKLVVYPHSIEWRNNAPIANRAPGRPVPFEQTEPLRAECEHFVECVRNGTRPRTDGREALAVLRVLAACQAQLDQRSPRQARAASPAPAAAPDGQRSDPATGARYFAHESSYIDDGVSVGEGTTIWHFSHLLPGTRVGRHCRIGQNVVAGPNVSIGDNVKIQNNVSVYEGVTLEDDVFCGPSMVFTNVINPRSEIRRMDELRPTRVGRGATFGANATVVCGTTIGRYAFVGAGAVVTRDVPDYALVVGNPARIAGWMCRCGVRLDVVDDAATCTACDRSYELRNGRLEENEAEDRG